MFADIDAERATPGGLIGVETFVEEPSRLGDEERRERQAPVPRSVGRVGLEVNVAVGVAVSVGVRVAVCVGVSVGVRLGI